MTGTETTSSARRKTAGFGRRKPFRPLIDMTPMVDLGFLLISFFVFTTQWGQPRAMQLIMPDDGPGMELGKSYALTIIPASGNRMYYYHGDWETAVTTAGIYPAGYSGTKSIREVISEKQQWLDAAPGMKEGRAGLMLLIKPSPNSSYKNIVDLLDEAMISDVKKYALLSLSGEEMDWLKDKELP